MKTLKEVEFRLEKHKGHKLSVYEYPDTITITCEDCKANDTGNG